jgi:hypothetical protein
MGKGSRQTGPMLALCWLYVGSMVGANSETQISHIFRPLQLKKYKIMMNVCGLFLQ